MRPKMFVSVMAVLLLLTVPLKSPAAQESPAGAKEKIGEDEPDTIPPELFEGTYDAVGRAPDSDETYTTAVKIEMRDGKLVSTRKMGENTIVGKGGLGKTHESAPYLFFEYDVNGILYEGTYLFQMDFDNYPRLTGFFVRKDGETKKPGMEALFPTPR